MRTRGILLAVALAATGVLATGVRADASGGPGNDHEAPRPVGFAREAADWWTWALTAPTPVNPATDTTGAHCAVGQHRDGPWYLAGAFFPQGPITRRCVVPEDRDLFFPVINMGYFAFLNDPAEQRTEAFVRAQVACESGSTGSVTVDGRLLAASALVHEQSVVFSVQLPADNVFGLTPDVATGLRLSPSVDQGTYVLLRHLSRGRHTIHIRSTLSANCAFAQTNDVTYQLTVR